MYWQRRLKILHHIVFITNNKIGTYSNTCIVKVPSEWHYISSTDQMEYWIGALCSDASQPDTTSSCTFSSPTLNSQEKTSSLLRSSTTETISWISKTKDHNLFSTFFKVYRGFLAAGEGLKDIYMTFSHQRKNFKAPMMPESRTILQIANGSS